MYCSAGVTASLELSGDVGKIWNVVDSSSSNNHSWLSREDSGSDGVDLVAGDGIDLLAVLVEGDLSVGREVSGNLFESIALIFHGGEDVHFQDVLGSGKFFWSNWLLESVQFLKSNVDQVVGVRSLSFYLDSEESRVSEVRVDSRSSLNKVMLLQQVSDGSLLSMSMAGGSQKGVHNVESVNVFVLPWNRLESKADTGHWGLSPLKALSSRVAGGLSLELVLWDWEHVSESLLDQVDVLLVVLDTGGHDQALLWGDVVHHELLHES